MKPVLANGLGKYGNGTVEFLNLKLGTGFKIKFPANNNKINTFHMDNFGRQKFNQMDNFVPHTDRQTDRHTDTLLIFISIDTYSTFIYALSTWGHGGSTLRLSTYGGCSA